MECGCNAPNYGPYLANNCGVGNFAIFMALVDSVIRKTCDVSAICDRVPPKAQPDHEYDYIVIGAGSGGSTVGGRLAEIKNRKTLILEAGIEEPEAYQVPAFILAYFNNPLLEWNFKTTNEPVGCQSTNGSCTWLRSKTVGGCSVINGMMFTRGTPADFDKRWQGGGVDGWSFADVLPFFKKAEGNQQVDKYDSNFHGGSGPMIVSDHYYVPEFTHAIIKGAAEAGYPISQDLNGVNFTGFAIPQSYIKNGSRVSMAKAYLRPQRHNPNLHLMINSTVTRIIFNSNKRATGVEFIYNNVTYKVNASKEIILAAGTMNSPKILLQSGVGPKDALDAVGIEQIHDLPGVGHNLTNHVAFAMSYNVGALLDLSDTTTNETLETYVNTRGGPLASPGLPITSRLPSSVGSASDPDIQMFFQLSGHKCSSSGESNLPFDSSNPNAVKTLTISAVCLQPKSRGRITLKSNNPLDPPLMVGNYLTVKDDEDRLIDGIRLVQKLANSTTLRDTWNVTYIKGSYGNCEVENEFDSDDYWRCAVRYSTGAENHQASTLRMGPTNDKWTVVDNHLRVVGLKGLMVADASAMPVVTSSNTNAPIVMVAERAADFIRRRS